MKIIQAYPAFFSSFKHYLPELQLAYGYTADGEDYLYKDLVYDADLIVFSGGEDINPILYGEDNRHSYFNADRDLLELEILRMGIALGKKLLGVCRGHQLINAHLGGKLVQDLRSDLKINHPGFHKLKDIAENSFAGRYFSSGVNSLHHQGVIKAGEGLNVTSFYGGVIESTENENIITVQWHPEFMGDSYDFFENIKLWSIS